MDEKTILNSLKGKLGMKQMNKVAITWWGVWYFRNQIIFNNCTKWDSSSIAEFIKRQYHNWSQSKRTGRENR